MAVEIGDLYATLEYPPNREQQRAIESTRGALRIIAGPGSGKTHVLVLRTLNLLACEGVDASRIVVTTFTDKAAAELQDRLRLYASRLPNAKDLHIAELNVGTIHWFCGVVLRRFHPELRRYEPLDELSQQLFIYDNFTDIFEGLVRVDARDRREKWLGKWSSKTSTVSGAIEWFNKVTEETITSQQLRGAGDDFLTMLATAYERYAHRLRASGYLDFSFILRELHDLLCADPAVLRQAQEQYDFFMIDEYQDTNYVQEEVLIQLAAPEFNIAVVGDDDQSLYRFRGATVRNILEFSDRMRQLDATVGEVALRENYRSHPDIIRAYQRFMDDGNWTSGSTQFRTAHDVVPDPNAKFAEYPSVGFHRGSADELAEIVKDIIDRGVVQDPSQIAILFNSVAGDGPPVIDALRTRGVETYAPRARRYLEHEEVRCAVGVLRGLIEFEADRPTTGPVSDTVDWADAAYDFVCSHPGAAELREWLTQTQQRFAALSPRSGQDMGASLLDLLYESFRFEPFASFLRDPVAARNLGYFTTLVRTFQQQFRIDVLHPGVRRLLPWRLWASFFYLLQSTGLDDVEDDDAGAPLGLVQVMTIHQSKGLEFPVVIVGSLEKRPRSGKALDRALSAFYPRGSFEPETMVTEFDARRQYYVAFSRAQHLLIAHAPEAPYRFFAGFCDRASRADITYIRAIAPSVPTPSLRDPNTKPVLSLTGQVNVYRRCPRQFAFFSEYGFAPSFAAQVFFGTVVHQTIEDIHRHVLDARPEPLDDETVQQYFLRNSELLRKRGIHPLAPSQREEAERHVLRYLAANRDRLDRVRDTEVEVSLEQPAYVLNGRIDLIEADDGQLELVDFKAQRRLESGDDFDHYKDQLALYRYLVEQRYDEAVGRTVLYFTGEETAADARLHVDVTTEDIESVVNRFDETAHRIIGRDFAIRTYPPRDTCRACDFRSYCRRRDSDTAPRDKRGSPRS